MSFSTHLLQGRRALAVSLIGLPALLAGCLSIADPPEDAATRHVRAARDRAAYSAAAAENVGPVQRGWLATFDDATLTALVDEALGKNPDLYTAAARVDEARARLRAAGALLVPRLDAVGTAQRFDAGGENGPDTAFALGLRASWEVDLWGRIRSDRAAAREIAEAAGLDYLQARHSLAAAVCETYFTILAAREQLAIDRDLLAAEQFTAAITAQRVGVGVALGLDEDVAVANVALAESAIQQDLSALQEAGRALEVLLGRYPDAELADTDAALPTVPGPATAGVPSQLLERRPDVLAAEQQVNAAFYNVQSARAARLPSLTLSAAGGTPFDADELFWSIAADVLGPLFTGGQLEALVDVATAQQRQAIGQYASVVLAAFREVETALANERFLAAQEAQLSTASQRLRQASQVAENRYEGGVLTILDLTQVRRQDFQTRAQLLGVRLERLRQRLNLYLALGGPIEAVPANETQEPTDGQ